MSVAIIRALRRTLLGALIMGVFVVLGIIAPKAQAATGVNQQLNFQGRLLTSQGATVADGYYNMQFKIYQDGTGTVAGNPSGTLKWTESWLNTDGHGVEVRNGYLSVQLGSITSLSSVDWNQDTLWLSINVGNTNTGCTPFTSCSGDGEMLPMKRLSSTPYALNAGQLGGLTSAQFLQLAQGVQTEAGTNTDSIAINKTGTGNFINLQANAVDVFTIADTGDITFGNNIDHSITVADAPADTAGVGLTISAGTAGTGAGALTGGTLTLQGGDGGGTGGDGGDLVLDAGAGVSGGTGGTITIGGTNASAVQLGQDTTVAAGKSLTLTGGDSNSRPTGSEGMLYYDSETKQLLVYSNGKWQADKSSAILVAASNSSAADKAAADYIATGSSDQTQINQALTAADPAGSGRKTGKVYLFAGTYTINGTVSIPNNTTLAGTGSGTIITIPASTNASFTAVTNSAASGSATGIVVQDLKLDGNKSGQTAGSYAMYGILFNGVGSATLAGGKINNVWVNNWYGNGVAVWTSSGIYINGGSRNTVSNIVAQDNSISGVIINTSTYTTVTGSDFRGNSYGIYVAGNNNTITGNSASGNTSNGIYMTGSQNTISGNVATGNTNTNIYLYNASSNTISGNQTVGSPSADGIGLAATSTYNIVSSNTVQSNSTGGIYLGSPATNNTITANKIHNNGGNNNKGIYLVGASSNTITNNTITDTANSSSNNPINIDASSNNNYLSGNTFSSTATGGTIADAGTGTVYANQSRAEGGGQITNRVANNAAAFTFQNASGTDVLTVNTSTSAVLIAGALDTTTATTLSIGNANATGVDIATNNTAHTINIATGAAAQSVTIGSTNTTSGVTIQSGSGGIALNGTNGGIALSTSGGANLLTLGAGGSIATKSDSQSFQDASGNLMLGLDRSTNLVRTAWNTTLNVEGGANFETGITIQGDSVSTQYTSPLGSSFASAINITNADLAAYGSILAMGVTSGSSATARGLIIADARTTAHQPTIAILTRDENYIGGLSYDGTTGTNAVLSLKNTASTVSLQGGGINLLSSSINGTDAITTLGVAATNAGKLAFMTSANSYYATIAADTQTSNYTLRIPALSSDATICTSSGNCGATLNANDFIQNQNTAPQTANFYISGTGQAASLTAGTVTATSGLVATSLDTSSGTALNIGGTYASSVNIGKSGGTTNIKSNTVNVGTAGATTTINGAAQTAADTAGNDLAIKGSAGLGTGNGGNVSIQGGNAGASGTLGGNLTLAGGTGTTSNGLVILGTSAFQTTMNDSNCFPSGSESTTTSNCTISQNSVNNSAAVIVGFTNDGQTAFMPDPSVSTAGRVVYVTASSNTKDFTLSVNGGGTGNQIAMRKNTTATMIWNGADWTAAGASSSTTLQAAYDNTLQSAGGAELVVSKTSATNGLTIRDASGANAVNGTLLSIQTSSAANLLTVNSNVTEYTSNSGAETYSGTTTTFPSSTWVALTGATVTRNVTTTNIATGQGSAQVVTSTSALSGVKNVLNTSLTAGQHYNVSFSAKLSSGTFTDMGVYYSVDGSTDSVACTTGQAIKTSVWTKVNCIFTAPSSGITSSNSINIRQVGSGTARTFYVDNISVTIAADYNYATDGGVNDNTNFSTNWTAVGTSSVARYTSDGEEASDSARVIAGTTANNGIQNKLSINPLTSTLYRIAVHAKLSAGSAFTDFKIRYTPDNGSTFVDCVDYNSQTIVTTGWTQITCYINTSSTTVTNPYVQFIQPTAPASARTYLVDAFYMTLASNTTPNVQVGSGSNGGPTTLFTLDKAASAPIAANNDALLGSMYYDTTLGKLQCYEADGWGACGSSPDNIITISPEYTNAVLHGTGIGTMTSDLCSDYLNVNDGSSGQPTICGTNETYNFYKWTSPQATTQTYSIYVTYQLPSTFKSFNSGQTSLMARTDNGSVSGASSTVQYSILKNVPGSGTSPCGGTTTVSTGTQTTWQTVTATGAADPSTCGFTPGSSIVFKIDTTVSRNANAYVGNLNFAFSNN